MSTRLRGRIAIGVWLAVVLAAAFTVARARFTADLTAFLPTRPTPEQALLIDQLREGPTSHLILVAVTGGDRGLPDEALAKLSRSLAARVRIDPRFLSINNGETVTAERDRALLFEHRYLLSDQVRPERFTRAGLHAALGDSLDLLASSAGLMLQPLLTRDPTAELLHLVDGLTAGRDLPMVDGVWIARSREDGAHALLVAETRAAGSDIDGQQAAIDGLRAAFASAREEVGGTGAATARLVLTGPPVFAVDARATIERDATRLSILGAVLVTLLLGFVYRSLRALLLGLLPMLTGALCGLAAIAGGFGVVHAIALGFGVTLIGEAVDYAIYLFVQGRSIDGSERDCGEGGERGFWSTIALGVATSTIGFGALMFSGFEGLAQIGALSIVGLVVAALVTRWVLPAWMPAGFAVRPMPALGRLLERCTAWAPALRIVLALLAVASIAVLAIRRDAAWSRELSSLSPLPVALQEQDGRLRGELGAPDVRDVVVVRAVDEERALQATERVVDALTPLIADGALAGVEAATRYLPSRATQRARQAALPDDATLRRDFDAALDGLPFVKTGFDGFFADVAREKNGGLLTRADLDGTSIAFALRALLAERASAAPDGKSWTAIVALRSAQAGGTAGTTADAAPTPRQRIAAALGPLEAARGEAEVRWIDIQTETQAIYAGYLSEALRTAALGALAIVVLLAAVLRDAVRLARVVAPLAIAVVLVAAAHLVLEGPLTLFHFVGLLLIVAVGSNYTLFFDRLARLGHGPGHDARHALLVSLLIANGTGVIGFGVLGLSSLPVLHAIGTTVAPGALLALIGAAAFASPGARGTT